MTAVWFVVVDSFGSFWGSMPNRFGVSLTARGNGAAQPSGQCVVSRRPRTAPRTPATQQCGIPAFLEQDLEDYLQRLDSQQLADGTHTHWGALNARSAHSVWLHLTLSVSLAVRDCVSHWASLSHCLTAARFNLLRLKTYTVGPTRYALTRCASISHCLCVAHCVL